MASILALSFHPAFYPPKSGGELRLYYIYYYLSKQYNITLVSFTYPNPQNKVEIVEHTETFREIRVPKTELSWFLHRLIDKTSPIKECSAVVTSIESKFNKKFKDIVAKEVKEADFVVFVSPYLFTLSSSIVKGKRIIYESYNLEYELMEQSLGTSLIGRLLLKYVYNLERSLSEESNLIFAVSEEDKNSLSTRYNISKNKIYISPNGVNSTTYDNLLNINQGRSERTPICIFVGSYHPPNIEAIDKITQFAHSLPDAYFIIAGSSSQYYLNHATDMVELQDDKGIQLLSPENLALSSGFYDIEYWGSNPVIWSQPQFRIKVPKGVDLIELEAYSPCNQELEVKLEDRSIHFKLKETWNSIKISNENKKGHSAIFLCQKKFDDNKRTLGLALKEIFYYKNDNKINIDLTKSYKPIYVFKKAKNVLLLGQISDEEKLELYRSADVALNPMLGGSGTNIKMLDYMVAGLPVITTAIGARGLDLENYHSAMICEITEFPAKILEVLSDKDLYNKLKENGRSLVKEKYDWEMIADSMGLILEEKLS